MKLVIFFILVWSMLLPLAVIADAQQTQMAGKYTVTLTSSPNPTVAGDNVFRIVVKDNQQPLVGGTVSIHVDMPAMSMPSDFSTTPGQVPGEYIGKVYLGMSGEWKATISVQRMPDMTMDGDGQTDYLLNAVRLSTVALPATMSHTRLPGKSPFMLLVVIGGLGFLCGSLGLGVYFFGPKRHFSQRG